MAQAALRMPVISKSTHAGGNARLSYAASAMQGYRNTMEDAHATIEDLDVSTNTSFFGVYDGHGGCAVARYCANHLHTKVLEQEDFSGNLPNALGKAFLRMDDMLRNQEASRELTRYNSGYEYFRTADKSSWLKCTPCLQKPVYRGPLEEGCTACVVLIRNNQIVVGNAGDARCVISRMGQATALSNDHKPNFPAESARIQAAGKIVTFSRGCYRVGDGIAVSRSIGIAYMFVGCAGYSSAINCVVTGIFLLYTGDLLYKQDKTKGPDQQALTCCPDITSTQITDDTEFLVIACDGIWDVLSNQAVVDFVNMRLRRGMTLALICESLLHEAVSHDPPSMDNMSVILVVFHHADKKNPGQTSRRRSFS
uniref:protein-serine/threonine phosphatase n=1 Tax=Leersia perrieri TaxID=77586 RepID=A0A0D9W6T0_9ORYZ